MTQTLIDNGPFFHGTKAELKLGDELNPKHGSNFETGRISNYVYFTGTLEAAKWGAELAQGDGQERIYVVEPLGDFENDPNLTDKRFPGNPTRSFRSQLPLKVVAELATWERHSDEVINQMLANLEQLRKDGLAEILD
ncbi:NAD(+)--rifampin ADP-ribosyltransferase [uncultured Vagococcus sp.]|uniref:NAD(+)--rifampin ADP-ribosyltransferase n=1 Tax=uncultured Vagococcus sp. TaxID=189676 RepID=UPI0028D40291|nr:NAD(+)--rifampin ADP-ribosyltransferase [uncultured Vagococcus sp.]